MHPKIYEAIDSIVVDFRVAGYRVTSIVLPEELFGACCDRERFAYGPAIGTPTAVQTVVGPVRIHFGSVAKVDAEPLGARDERARALLAMGPMSPLKTFYSDGKPCHLDGTIDEVRAERGLPPLPRAAITKSAVTPSERLRREYVCKFEERITTP